MIRKHGLAILVVEIAFCAVCVAVLFGAQYWGGGVQTSGDSDVNDSNIRGALIWWNSDDTSSATAQNTTASPGTGDQYLDFRLGHPLDLAANEAYYRFYTGPTGNSDYWRMSVTPRGDNTTLGDLALYTNAGALWAYIYGDSNGMVLRSNEARSITIRRGTSPGFWLKMNDAAGAEAVRIQDSASEDQVVWGSDGVTTHVADAKVVFQDGASTGPFVVSRMAFELLIEVDGASLSDDSVSTSGVNGTVTDGWSTLLFRFPIPNRENGAKVVVDRITINFSSVDETDTARFYLYSDKAGSPSTVASDTSITASSKQVLTSDVVLEDDRAYYMDVKLFDGDSINDSEVDSFMFEYHTQQ